jgi:hypothetical protein
VDEAANLNAVNNALARLAQEKNIPEFEKLGVAAHLRAHRVDAGLPAALAWRACLHVQDSRHRSTIQAPTWYTPGLNALTVGASLAARLAWAWVAAMP